MVKRGVVLLIFLLILLFLLNYSWMSSYVVRNFDEKEKGVVERIIDGDTIIVEDKSVRLLGINTPERDEKYYSEAKKFLENLILNKTIELEKEKEDLDKYGRQLRYVFLDNKNIDLIMVEQGFANPYFPSGKDKYSKEFYNEWDNCILKDINLCEKSKDKCSECIFLKNISIKNQKVILYNKCAFECDLRNWVIKEEGRKKVLINKSVESYKEIIIETPEFWTSTRDSLYLRDNEKNLVLYYHY